jgi:crotonobetainyl-CoA:carnitine CoA-transferase CaiB-like acyl-CoA transferase
LLKETGFDDGVDASRLGDDEYVRQAKGVQEVNVVVARLVGSFKFERDLWLDAQRVGLPWAPIRRPEENAEDPHWWRRETFFTVEHPELGRSFTEVGAKWVAHGLSWRTGPRAPLLGEHNADVLSAADQREPRAELVDPAPGTIASAGVSKWGKPWALGGVRVLDLGWLVASAGAGRFLAALGAEVIKVEHKSKIDMMRPAGAMAPDGLRAEREAAVGPVTGSPTSSLNRGGAFMEINAGKRAISLNLKTAKGKELLKELVKNADVLVEGYSPGTLERMGLGYDVLRQINPRIVYVQQSGMGEGLYGSLRSFGPTAQAMSGLSDMSGLPEPYPPAGIGYSYLDWGGAYQLALAMVAGLFRQRTTGEGCRIESSQVEAGIYGTGTAVLDHSANGRRWQRYGNRSPFKPASPHGIYRVRGRDRWIAIAAFDESEWLALARTLARPEWTSDSRFASLDLRVAHQDELDALVDEATRDWDGVELMMELQDAGVPAGLCSTAEDRCEWDPQLAHLGWLMELDQSEIGRWPTKTPPAKFSETPPYQGGIVDRHGPSYGEDNDYVYGRLLGLEKDEIAALARDGVI